MHEVDRTARGNHAPDKGRLAGTWEQGYWMTMRWSGTAPADLPEAESDIMVAGEAGTNP